MTLSFIQLAQSVAGAVIAIVALLIVAAIIGYLTSWFYAKSVYTPIIKGLEAEKEDLQNQVANLKNEISKLNATIANLNDKIGKQEADLAKKDKELQELKKKVKG
jgi:peptidoglycan hydrolase CwlO-like protein